MEKIEDKILGLSIEEATAYVKNIDKWHEIRAVRVDGVGQCMTLAYCPYRFNVHTEKGIIVKVSSLG